jgi:hypothetical protein
MIRDEKYSTRSTVFLRRLLYQIFTPSKPSSKVRDYNLSRVKEKKRKNGVGEKEKEKEEEKEEFHINFMCLSICF